MSDSQVVEDVWHEICEYLETRDLFNLCLTSRTINHVGTRYLYRKIKWDWKGKKSRYRIMSLWTALVQDKDKRSRLCGFVREVHLLGSTPPKDTRIVECPEIHESNPSSLSIIRSDKVPFYQEIDYLRDVVSSVVESQKGRLAWFESIAARNVYALVALLLPILHNLRSLKLDYTFAVHGGYPGQMIESLTSGKEIHSAELQNNFEHLEVFDYGTNALHNNLPHSCDNTYIRMRYSSQLIPIFQLQQVKHLKIWLRSRHGLLLARIPDVQMNHWALETLVLDHISVMDCALFKIFKGTNKLRSLHLGMNAEEKDFCKYIWNGLRALCGCLEHLSISFSVTPGSREYHIDTIMWGPLFRHMTAGFFQDFTRLKTLELPIQMLNGFRDIMEVGIQQDLPVTLEKLGLRWDFRDVQSYDVPTATVRILWVLTEFLRLPDRHQRVPLLQEVIIRLFIGEDGLSRTVVDCDDLIEQFNMEQPGPTLQEQEGDEADDTMEEAMFLAQLVAEEEVGQAAVVVAVEEAAEEEEMVVEGEAEDES
ncbi:hypothetical protein AnigIFM56816_000476 [Aspergillus niger]|nr:hypothetical protein AnigIFM56816_000476 [Aspergillus niger]